MSPWGVVRAGVAGQSTGSQVRPPVTCPARVGRWGGVGERDKGKLGRGRGNPNFLGNEKGVSRAGHHSDG